MQHGVRMTAHFIRLAISPEDVRDAQRSQRMQKQRLHQYNLVGVAKPSVVSGPRAWAILSFVADRPLPQSIDYAQSRAS